MDLGEAHALLARHLRESVGADGGVAPSPEGVAEIEPTILAALALGDRHAAEWVEQQQADDGSLVLRSGRVANVAVTALGAFVLDGRAREKALDAAVEARAETLNDEREGWGWTTSTYSWVEPTARVLLALRCLRADEPAIAEAESVLAERECAGGGWNYGNNTFGGTDLEPYVQTTAVAVLALQGSTTAVASRGLQWLRERWSTERGGLSLAQSLAALRLAGADELTPLVDALVAQFERTAFLGSRHALGWAAFATAPDERFELIRAKP